VKSRENPIPTRNHENGTWIKQSAIKEKKRKEKESIGKANQGRRTATS
jgi:hypothetical protein